MYLYDELDRTLVTERVAEFRDQVGRRLSGELTEDEFRPLRLMNGIYLQLHAYMLRIAIPYGTLSSAQMRMLAHVARRYDRNFGHFTTRQNIQFHWIKLEELPDAMADLASVGLHGMQTSGNCVRNITTDQWAGAAPDEIEDPRIWAEVLRQHLTMHPEFSFLPRKFKIALTAATHDRAAVKVHDIGLRLFRNGAGETGFEVMVGGGLGRTPFIAKTIKPFLPKRDLLSYVEAILRVRDRDLAPLHINISGCINACGHHHVGNIGILGVEKNNEEFYQITIGGRADENAALGTLIGPAVRYAEVVDVVEDIVAAYVELREDPQETFLQTVDRTGIESFRERVYATR